MRLEYSIACVERLPQEELAGASHHHAARVPYTANSLGWAAADDDITSANISLKSRPNQAATTQVQKKRVSMMEEKSNSYKIGVQHLQLYEYSVVLRLRSFDKEISTSRKKKKNGF